MTTYAQRKALGDLGEELAAQYLRDLGMRIIERNYRCQFGEIDIVAADGDMISIVEVKTRSSTRFGLPAEAIDARKAQRLKRLAAHWMQHRKARAAGIRIDIVSVLLRPDRDPEIGHVQGLA